MKLCLQSFACLIFFVLFLSGSALAQSAPVPAVDSFVLAYDGPSDDLPTLARELTTPFATDLEKARALFLWIAANVRYDCKKYHNREPMRLSATSEAELAQKVAAYRREQAERTAKYRRGICEDYSQLFKALCDEAGLEAVVVSGNARDFYRPYRNNHNLPHAWNAVRIDGQWHLLDATWGAGYTNPEVTKFSPRIATGYFMTPPAWFALNHFPDDPRWQLLERPLDERAFARMPLVNYGQDEYPLREFAVKVAETRGRYDRELRLRFEQSPPFFALTKQNGHPVEFEHRKEDGYDVFRFSGRGVREMTLFGGERARSRMGWLARYEL